jgi:hypothetical protein
MFRRFFTFSFRRRRRAKELLSVACRQEQEYSSHYTSKQEERLTIRRPESKK